MRPMRDAEETATAAVELADLALAFGRIDRTGVTHPDGRPESDSDHTVMLAWIAPSLADLVNERYDYEYLNVNRVAAYAAVHDAVEVYAGDTPTINITDDELAAKESREMLASIRLATQFRGRLPWFSEMVRNYEKQRSREARFVRSVDKLMPKVVHLLDNLQGLHKYGTTRAEFVRLVDQQRRRMVDWLDSGSEGVVLGVYDVLCQRVLELWGTLPTPDPQPHQERHLLEVRGSLVMMHHAYCMHPADGITCPYTLAYDLAMKESNAYLATLNSGEYPVTLDERGELVFVDTQGD